MTEETIEGEAVELDGEAALPVVTSPGHSTALVARDEINVAELVGQSEVIHQAMKLAMTENVHYGRVGGVDKPTLLKPGAEKLLVLFRLAPAYESEKIWQEENHLTVMTKCTLSHIPTGLVVAEGEGMCSTHESRYAWRKGGRVCPECGQAAIIKGRAEYGGGWLCYEKKGGCKTKWEDGSEQAKAFEEMSLERVANPDLPDQWNTVLKMADKRALLAAVLNGTAASDVFTQDMEDSGGGPAASGAPEEESTIVDSGVFNPAKTLRPDAPRGGWKKIADLMTDLDPSIEWAPIIRQAIAAVYGGDGDFRKLKEPAKTEAAYRTANTAGKLSELFQVETFLSDESIIKAFAEMFEGVVVTIESPNLEKEAEDDSDAPLGPMPKGGADDIAFGEAHVGTAHPDE